MDSNVFEFQSWDLSGIYRHTESISEITFDFW